MITVDSLPLGSVLPPPLRSYHDGLTNMLGSSSSDSNDLGQRANEGQQGQGVPARAVSDCLVLRSRYVGSSSVCIFPRYVLGNHNGLRQLAVVGLASDRAARAAEVSRAPMLSR